MQFSEIKNKTHKDLPLHCILILLFMVKIFVYLNNTKFLPSLLSQIVYTCKIIWYILFSNITTINTVKFKHFLKISHGDLYKKNNEFLVKTKFGQTFVPFVSLTISPYEIISSKYAFMQNLYLLWVYKITIHIFDIYLFSLYFLWNGRLRTGQYDESFVPFVTMRLFFFPMISMSLCL